MKRNAIKNKTVLFFLDSLWSEQIQVHLFSFLSSYVSELDLTLNIDSIDITHLLNNTEISAGEEHI